MTCLDRDAVARLRLEREGGRLDDLRTLVERVLDGTGDDRATTLRDRVVRRASSVESIAAGTDLLTTWQDEEQGSDSLVGEVLAAVMTRLLRDHGLDDGTFAAAEALLDELAGAARIESLALGQTQEVESVDHARRTVALRFPGARIWDLPFLVHEFGHHAVRRVTHVEPLLSEQHPLEEVTQAVADTLRHQGVEPDRQRAHADELMADSVATIASGPVYAVACLCLRPTRTTEAPAPIPHGATGSRRCARRSTS